MKFNIYTLGCKVNTYESEAITSLLEEKGMILTSNDLEADVIIVNTCTVTHTSDSKSRKMLRSLANKNPNALIVVMGCYSQLNKEEASQFANIVIGTTNRTGIYDFIMSYLNTKESINVVDELFNDRSYEEMRVNKLTKHTRGFIKIQDGCENFCAYCAIPYSRGPIRSRNPESVISEVNDLVNQGVNEIILSGINTGTYGYDLKTINLAKLIERICLETSIKRIRLSSIELMEITDELLDTIKKYQDRVANHLHIPLQAGSDNTLKRMNRKYLTDEYRTKIKQIKEMFNDVAITTDCLAGFVGETEEDFKEAIDFIKEMQFASMHIFPYSRRKNTKADSLDGHLNPTVIHNRASIMIETAKVLKQKYESNFLNKTVSVLIETTKKGYYIGHSSNYLEVYVKSDIDLTNKFCDVLITSIENDIMKGEVVCVL